MSLNIPFVPWENIPGYELLAPHLHNLFFEVYKNDGDEIFVCIFDQEFEFQRVFAFSEGLGELLFKDALEQLVEDKTAYEEWENDMLLLGNFTIEDLEEKYKNGEYGDLVANNDGVYFDDLGYAGRSSLAIPEDIEDVLEKLEQKPAAPVQGNNVTRQGQQNQTSPNKSQEQTEPVLPKRDIAQAEDPEENEAAAKARKKATEVVQRCDELSGYQRTSLIKEAIALMHTVGIITDEQNEQLSDLICWIGYFDEIESKFIAKAICDAADKYVMTGAATIEIKAGDDSGRVNLTERFEKLKTAYDIAHKANNHAHEAVKLKDAVRKEIEKAERYEYAYLRARGETPLLLECEESCREAADIKQESVEKELEASRAASEKLEYCIVPDIMALQELQDIIDTTMTSADEVIDQASFATAIYDKIKNMYEVAEQEWLGDKLRYIFNTAT